MKTGLTIRVKHMRYTTALWILTMLFLSRVLGQLWVALYPVGFLPPMAEWSSGLIPYPLLLPIQVLILGFQGKVNLDVSRKRGFFGMRKTRIGKFLLGFSAIYFAAMAARYVVTMALFPERRWLGGTLPIFFHWVLAAYLFILGCFHRREEKKP